MTTRAPSLIEVVRRHVDSRLVDMRVALPARIESFNRNTQLASVKPLLHETHESESGDEVVEPLPVIANVPVQFPGAGGFALTFPVQPGDPCLLVFSDRALDRWIESGEDVDPVDARRHHLSDAVAILGVRHRRAASEVWVEEEGATLGSALEGVRVRFLDDDVHLGVKPNKTSVEAAVHGTIYREKEKALHADLREQFEALAQAFTAFGAAMPGACSTILLPSAGVAVADVAASLAAAGQAACTQAAAKIAAFEAEAEGKNDYLSQTVKVG